ncbi:circadian clock KaiB family protein [Kovacikia minuta CCNUW1]|uniref:circadian clock KaiB family protein n=1 Tax=Kovacikia minuta TaxID=2931930 RepID=UPI001CCFEB79|nr:circadian clock KaiB family protein [Kovacikia minuta]UBF24100.1 circadian clock KaiB family protein [Kovacikia minuta CCNUW1]
MNSTSATLPNLFKGIALFTPGGGLVYCIDPDKQNRWHLHLCALLRDILGLPEPPHFLVPCYTATVDRWLDARTGQVQTVAEAAPAVLRHGALLNAVFGTENLTWQKMPVQDGLCDPIVLSIYRKQFPQLWKTEDLLVRYDRAEAYTYFPDEPEVAVIPAPPTPLEDQGYVFRLFVSGSNTVTERTMKILHQLLEESLCHPYTLKVIDVRQHPEQAELDQVSATPTLVRVWPEPARRVVGNLDNVNQLLWILRPAEG